MLSYSSCMCVWRKLHDHLVEKYYSAVLRKFLHHSLCLFLARLILSYLFSVRAFIDHLSAVIIACYKASWQFESDASS